MTASEPPELPEPEVEYRRPAWVEPPADMVPGFVPVELILARTLDRAPRFILRRWCTWTTAGCSRPCSAIRIRRTAPRWHPPMHSSVRAA